MTALFAIFGATSFDQQYIGERHLAERHLAERHLAERHLSNRGERRKPRNETEQIVAKCQKSLHVLDI